MKNTAKEVTRQPWKREPPKTHPSPGAWRTEGPANRGSLVPPYIEREKPQAPETDQGKPAS